jgi:CRP-like cAMP-binding protein
MVAIMAFDELPLMNKPLRLLFRKAESKTFLKREVIFSSDDLADSVYLVKSGGIRCYEYIDGDKRTRSIYFAGDILGYEQLFGRKKYDFYAEVFSEKAVIRVLSYNRFKSILEKDTEFCFSFMWHLERQKIFWFNRFIVKSSELSKGLVIIFLEELAQKNRQTSWLRNSYSEFAKTPRYCGFVGDFKTNGFEYIVPFERTKSSLL